MCIKWIKNYLQTKSVQINALHCTNLCQKVIRTDSIRAARIFFGTIVDVPPAVSIMMHARPVVIEILPTESFFGLAKTFDDGMVC